MRTNRKLDRLRLREVDAAAKLDAAMGTPRMPHRLKILKQRRRILAIAEANGDYNREVNAARNLRDTPRVNHRRHRQKPPRRIK